MSKLQTLQGDAFSVVWFCMSINPLSTALTSTTQGYNTDDKEVKHLMYMEDIKLISTNKDEKTYTHNGKVLELWTGKVQNQPPKKR